MESGVTFKLMFQSFGGGEMAIGVPHDRNPSKLDVFEACDGGGVAVFAKGSEKDRVIFGNFREAGFATESQNEVASDGLGGPTSRDEVEWGLMSSEVTLEPTCNLVGVSFGEGEGMWSGVIEDNGVVGFSVRRV